MASAWSQDRNYFKKLYRIQQVYNDEMLLSFPFDIYFFSLSLSLSLSLCIYLSVRSPCQFLYPICLFFSVNVFFIMFVFLYTISLCLFLRSVVHSLYLSLFLSSISLSLSLSLCLSSSPLSLSFFLSSISICPPSLSLVACDNVLTGSMKEAV